MAHIDIFLETDPSAQAEREMPSLLKVRLGKAEFELMKNAKWVYDFARTKMHHRSGEDALREIAVEFTVGDYRVQNDKDPEQHQQWDGVLEEWLMHLTDHGFRFGAKYVSNSALVRMRSEYLSFEDFAAVQRDFLAAEMADRLESAMPGHAAPAPSKSSGMAPI